MKVGLRIGGRERRVEIEQRGAHARFRLDGRDILADVAEVTPGTYSVLLGGRAFEVKVEAHANGVLALIGSREYSMEIIDARQWRNDRSSAAEAQGRQQLVAPMPGKIVRLLVKTGEAVEAGQGLLVVEAMKMQNEIKSPKSGKVERLMAREGQAVSAGETLIVIS